ncbi:hypothetical protein C8R46DRAFT_1028580 [Mycena filopes]|nr:hypothetical protein C8R46DRAFT_1028580 [Mycena filopes]
MLIKLREEGKKGEKGREIEEVIRSHTDGVSGPKYAVAYSITSESFPSPKPSVDASLIHTHQKLQSAKCHQTKLRVIRAPFIGGPESCICNVFGFRKGRTNAHAEPVKHRESRITQPLCGILVCREFESLPARQQLQQACKLKYSESNLVRGQNTHNGKSRFRRQDGFQGGGVIRKGFKIFDLLEQFEQFEQFEHQLAKFPTRMALPRNK